MASRHKAQKKASGGKAVYSGAAGKVDDAARSKKEGFKDGGSVPGMKHGGRMDKRARGGRIGYKSPFSSAKRAEKGNLT